MEKPNKNLSGIFWMLLAALLFSIMVAVVRQLGSGIPSYEIVFFRSVIQLSFLVVVFSVVGFATLKTSRPGLHFWRALLAVALINCNFYAFTKLPLADVTAIGFSRNLFLVVLAGILLHEKVSYHRFFVTLIGFVGIVFIVQPNYGTFQNASWIALLGASLGATMMVLIRKLTATDSNLVMMTYPALAITAVTSIPTYLTWVMPTYPEFGLIALMALAGMSGQWCLIQGFRLGEATAVAPASYVRLVFASTIGFYFFGEIPNLVTLVGSVIIVGSNIYLIVLERKGRHLSPDEPAHHSVV